VDPTISVTVNAEGQVEVEFTGTLQVAPSLNGPWTNLDATSPVIWPTTESQQFGRAVVE
jgi:hypothetical protein